MCDPHRSEDMVTACAECDQCQNVFRRYGVHDKAWCLGCETAPSLEPILLRIARLEFVRKERHRRAYDAGFRAGWKQGGAAGRADVQMRIRSALGFPPGLPEDYPFPPREHRHGRPVITPDEAAEMDFPFPPEDEEQNIEETHDE